LIGRELLNKLKVSIIKGEETVPKILDKKINMLSVSVYKMQALKTSFKIKKIEPTEIEVKAGDEDITVRLFAIPISIFSTKSGISPIVDVVVTADSNKKIFGELCTQDLLSSHKPTKVEDFKVINEGGTVVIVEDKEYAIKAEILNLNVYTDLRDIAGNPCVRVSSSVLTYRLT